MEAKVKPRTKPKPRVKSHRAMRDLFKHEDEMFVTLGQARDNVFASPRTKGDAMSVKKGENRPELRRVLRLRDSIAIIVGIIVGSGIFRTPTDVANQLDSMGSILLVWVVGGVAAFCGALTYAELASAWPRTGGALLFPALLFPALLFPALQLCE